MAAQPEERQARWLGQELGPRLEAGELTQGLPEELQRVGLPGNRTCPQRPPGRGSGAGSGWWSGLRLAGQGSRAHLVLFFSRCFRGYCGQPVCLSPRLPFELASARAPSARPRVWCSDLFAPWVSVHRPVVTPAPPHLSGPGWTPRWVPVGGAGAACPRPVRLPPESPVRGLPPPCLLGQQGLPGLHRTHSGPSGLSFT